MDGVVDFLILDSIYKTSVQTQWSNGSTFKSLIDNQYYTGTVSVLVSCSVQCTIDEYL